MSYNLTLQCGCNVYVACHPETGIAHSRVIERRGRHCAARTHEIGLHLDVSELLPGPNQAAAKPRETYQWGTGGDWR